MTSHENKIDEKFTEEFKNNLSSFYRFFSPQDSFSRLKIKNKASSEEIASSIRQYDLLYNTYTKNTLSGLTIINKLKDMIDLPDRGIGYNTVFIDTTGNDLFLNPEYWATKSSKSSLSAPVGAGQEFTATAYYQNLCSTGKEPPDTDVTINVIRMPFLSDTKKHTDDINLFLNYMPSIFPSQMVPYLDVEFQFPRINDQEIIKAGEKSIITKRYLNRPSLLRFLIGSSVPTSLDASNSSNIPGALTEADAALLSSITSPIAKSGKDVMSPGKTSTQESYITGMELFTSPQTLINMKGLNANGDSRLNDVKPFLPPATLTNVGITVLGSGLTVGVTAMHKASIEFKIHDKARLVEFSEFISNTGTQSVTVWITFGWLAPRGRGNEDVYAKFINETMLTRLAFTITTSSFSFDTMGQVSLKLELVSKGTLSMEQARMQTAGTKADSLIKKLPNLINEIQKLRKGYINKGQEAAKAFGKEIRIFNILDAAEAGKLDCGMEPTVFTKIIKEEVERLEKEVPRNDNNIKLMQAVAELYELDSTGISKYKSGMAQEAKDFAKSKFDSFGRGGEDPFLPSETMVNNKRIFSEDLVKVLKDVGQEPQPDKSVPTNKSTSTNAKKSAGAAKGKGTAAKGTSKKDSEAAAARIAARQAADKAKGTAK